MKLLTTYDNWALESTCIILESDMKNEMQLMLMMYNSI